MTTDPVPMAARHFTGVIFPIERPRVTMPFRATETKWYSDDAPHRGVDVAPWPGSHGRPVRMPVTGMIEHVGFHEFAGHEIVSSHVLPYEFSAEGLDRKVHTIRAGERFWLRMTHHHRVEVDEGPITVGQLVAEVGSTGRFTTGPHVHVELRKGRTYNLAMVLDPLHFFIAAIPGLRATLQMPW